MCRCFFDSGAPFVVKWALWQPISSNICPLCGDLRRFLPQFCLDSTRHYSPLRSILDSVHYLHCGCRFNFLKIVIFCYVCPSGTPPTLPMLPCPTYTGRSALLKDFATVHFTQSITMGTSRVLQSAPLCINTSNDRFGRRLWLVSTLTPSWVYLPLHPKIGIVISVVDGVVV
jgi:hypothetical protein